MTRATKFAAIALLTISAGCTGQVRQPTVVVETFDANPILSEAAQRYRDVASARNPSEGYPRATHDGRWQQTPRNEWTSGFFPGTLWLLGVRDQAERWTWPLALIPRGNYSHDLGFQYNSSFVNAYRATADERYRTEALNGARLLAARFNPTVGAIKSWDWMPANRPFPVIVDNMMNLELLFWGARQPGGDPNWRRIAIQHARTTAAHHLRADGGSYHVVVFDPANGNVLEKITHQGHANESTWARGQAWLVYGFTMAYRESGEPEFLQTAERVADYFVAHLPADGVPCWDFQAPTCTRDASAAAIAASGLIELSRYAINERYRATAQRILATLSTPEYRNGSEALVNHAVGNMPAGTEIDVGLSYGDYYYVEAVLRSKGKLPPVTPRLITARGELLRHAHEHQSQMSAAIAALRRQADSALTLPLFTVTAKTRVPPSGDKRDYMSFGPYWWPDSTKPNGLPYIRRDGEVNWELRRESDALRLYAFTDAVETLALAYYFTGDDRYAAAAATQLRSWFIDPTTRMNPHLKYGQAIPGVTEGRGIGIIDTRNLGHVTDAAALLPKSIWTDRDDAALRGWMKDYYNWLRTSEHGKDEADEANNHGTWYDVQIAHLALYAGDTATARAVLGQSVPARFAAQIDSTGKQPLEYVRTRSLHYSVENLDAMTRLAELARHVDVDLWRHPRLRAAIEFVAPYADSTRRWPGQQITAERADLFYWLLAKAQNAFGESRFTNVVRRQKEWSTHRVSLFYPAPPRQQNDSLLHAARLAVLPDSERTAWQLYLTRSIHNAVRDRAGRTQWTPAPAGQGFFVTRQMTPEWFQTAEAKQLGDILLTYQTPAGGWSKRISFTRPRAEGESYSSDDNWTWIGTLDNGSTTEQLEFLAALNAAQPNPAYQNAFNRGIDYLLAAQMPNGCFPQIYPLQGGYHDAITFNDDATINALVILQLAQSPNHPTAQSAVQRGIDCILRTQVKINGVKTVWGAQHDPITWQPIKARAYEHASLSGRESGAILDFLMRVPNPSDSVKAAVHAAAKWFSDNAIRGYSYVPRGELTPDANGGPLWARFYELGTNRPIFSDRDGIVRYNLSDVGEERRRGYLWYTDEPTATLRRYERWKRSN